MSAGEGSIEGLRAACDRAIAEVQRIQSALGIVQDRCDGALALMATLAADSTNDNLVQAQARIAILSMKAGEDLMMITQIAVGEIEAYASSR